MTPERFTQRALTGCAAGVLNGVLNVLAALEEASGQSHPLDMDNDTIDGAIRLRANDLSAAKLDEVAQQLGMGETT